MNNIAPFRNYEAPKEVEESKKQSDLPELTTIHKPRVEIQQNAAAAAADARPCFPRDPAAGEAAADV